MLSQHRLISFDQTPLFYRHGLPDCPIKGVVLIVHGMGEHGGRYQAFAQHLMDSGYECFIPDLRGFGLSGGRRAYAKAFSDFHGDLRVFHHWILRTHKDSPLFFLGHSFGGLVTSSYLAFSEDIKPKGLVLLSPIFGTAFQIPAWRHYLGLLAAYTFPYYAEENRVDVSFLTHDLALMKDYPKDTLIYHRITARLYRELARMMGRRAQIAARLNTPTLLLLAGDDRVVSKEKAVEFYDALKDNRKEIEIYQGWYHELLNEVARKVIYERVSGWLAKQTREQE